MVNSFNKPTAFTGNAVVGDLCPPIRQGPAEFLKTRSSAYSPSCLPHSPLLPGFFLRSLLVKYPGYLCSQLRGPGELRRSGQPALHHLRVLFCPVRASFSDCPPCSLALLVFRFGEFLLQSLGCFLPQFIPCLPLRLRHREPLGHSSRRGHCCFDRVDKPRIQIGPGALAGGLSAHGEALQKRLARLLLLGGQYAHAFHLSTGQSRGDTSDQIPVPFPACNLISAKAGQPPILGPSPLFCHPPLDASCDGVLATLLFAGDRHHRPVA